MKAVIQLFWRICLLRQSPAYLPTEGWFVAFVVVTNLLVSVLVSRSLDSELDTLTLITRVVVAQATYAGLVWLAAYLREFPGRFTGTLTALFGCEVIINSLFGVLLPLILLLDERAVAVLTLGFMIWGLSVAGFILAQALSVRVGIGVLLALGMSVLTLAAGNTAIGL